MVNENPQGTRVAIPVTDGFKQVERIEPRKALDKAGADTHVVSPQDGEARGWNFTDWG
jgi:protease I